MVANGPRGKGIVLEGPSGSGKTVALWKVWHDCLHGPGLARASDGQFYVPVWLPTDPGDPAAPKRRDTLPRDLQIAGWILEAAGAWRPNGDALTTVDKQRCRELADAHMTHSPPLLILCDASHLADGDDAQAETR